MRIYLPYHPSRYASHGVYAVADTQPQLQNALLPPEQTPTPTPNMKRVAYRVEPPPP